MSLITSLKNILMEGTSGAVGFAGAGIIGSAVENTVAPSVPLGTWTGGIVNLATKYFLYHYGVKYVPGVDKGAVKEGIATNLVLDLAIRLFNNGTIPASPTLFGYNILGDRRVTLGLPFPDSARDYTYAGPPSPGVETRQRGYGFAGKRPVGGLPWTPDVMERQRYFGSMPEYGMPFEQNPVKSGRERTFGFASGESASPAESSGAMFGMA